MQNRLYTIHSGGPPEFRVVADRFDLFALAFPPLWLIWHGLWISLGVLVALFVVAAIVMPLAGPPIMYGVAAILGFEGGAIARSELQLRGWSCLGTVEAHSEEGAEECFLKGEAV